MTCCEKHLQLFEGLFDVHITVDETSLYDVQQFANQNNINLAFAVGKKGVHCRQLMTSQHIDGKAVEVLIKAKALALKMQEAGIKVLRVKLEALAGTEKTQSAMEKFRALEEFKQICYAYEFHYKVQIDTKEQQVVFERLCDENYVSYAINALSAKKKKYPLISQRIRGNYDKALEHRATFRKKLEQAGLTILLDGTHYEAIIYDSNYALDEGFVPDPVEV